MNLRRNSSLNQAQRRRATELIRLRPEADQSRIAHRQRPLFPQLIATAALFAICTLVAAEIDLEYRAIDDEVAVGEVVEVGLYAVSDSEAIQTFAAADVIFGWDPAVLRFLGIDNTGAIPLASSSLPSPSFGLNEADPPADGDGLYTALAPLGDPAEATPEGALLTTFRFEAVAPASSSEVFMFEEGGEPTIRTVVFDGEIPNLDVTGLLIPEGITVIGACPWDCAQPADGVVNVMDLLTLLDAWGTADVLCDFNDDAVVNIFDLLEILAHWGTCP